MTQRFLIGQIRWLPLVLAFISVTGTFAQDEKQIAPVGRIYALTNVTVVPSPGKKIEKATVVIKDGLIQAVGTAVSIPTDAIIMKADSMYVYAGFIDGLSRTGVIKPKDEPNPQRPKDPGNPPADKAGITPQNDVRNSLNPTDKSVEELRNIGFTLAQVVPYGHFLPGTSAIVLLGGKSADEMVLVDQSGLYSELSGAQNVYPNTVMAVMAKWRELYRNASLTKSYQALYASNRSALTRPLNDRVEEAFYPVIDRKIPVVFKAEKILETQRVLTLKNDLGFSLTIGDLKEGYPMIDKVKTSGAKIFLSLDLPDEVKKNEKKSKNKNDSLKTAKTEKPKSAAELEKQGLEKRKNDAIVKYTGQAADFHKAGIVFGFSAMSAKTKDIQSNLRRMIAAGLPEEVALAALTTNPAKMLGLEDRLGTVENGKMANLVVSDKPYFNEKAKVRYVFVDGNLYKLDIKEPKKSNGSVVAKGNWSYTTETPNGTNNGKLTINDDNGTLSGTISNSTSGKGTEMKDVALDGNTLSFSFEYSMGGNTMKIDVSVKIDGDAFEGVMTPGKFGSFPMKGTRDPK
ncbi:MAG: amidohydrolase family protein [Bacteroidetes bacterium]|nr:amidohydrolase family protein [Bacteroidota bacterium]MBS1541664.1 amidohydrolase family protein [Bacteroidota bacterium]